MRGGKFLTDKLAAGTVTNVVEMVQST